MLSSNRARDTRWPGNGDWEASGARSSGAWLCPVSLALGSGLGWAGRLCFAGFGRPLVHDRQQHFSESVLESSAPSAVRPKSHPFPFTNCWWPPLPREVLDSFSPQIPQIFFCFEPPRAAPCKALRLTTFFSKAKFPSFSTATFRARPDPLELKN